MYYCDIHNLKSLRYASKYLDAMELSNLPIEILNRA